MKKRSTASGVKNAEHLECYDIVSVQVTSRDIKNGKRYSNNSCPISLALRRLQSFSDIEPLVVWYGIRGCGYRFVVSAKTRKFIRDFDAGRIVKPFLLTVSKPNSLEAWSEKGSCKYLSFGRALEEKG